MQQGGGGRRGWTRRRTRTIGVAASAVALLALAACTSGTAGDGRSPVAHDSTNGGSAPTTPSSSSSAASGPAIITAPHADALNPIHPVTVGIQHGKLTSVTMVNPAGKQVSGELDAGGTSWHNTEVLGYSKTYRITAQGVSDDGTPVTKKSRITTLTPDNMTMPYLTDVYGDYISDGGTYGVGMIVRVHFDEQVNRAKAERTLHVTTTPNVVGGWYWSDDQNVYWRPEHYYPTGTQVTVSAQVYGKDVGHGLFGQADQSVSFKIGQKRVAIANNDTHYVKVYFDDELVRKMPTSMGMGGSTTGKDGQTIYFWTMPGTYTVLTHENPAIMSSNSYGLDSGPYAYGPEKVYWSTKISTDGIYLHSAPWSIYQQGHENVSHGCLNLSPRNAKWYYNHSRVGDIVKVIHSHGPKLQFWQGGQWSVPWSEWLAGSAV